MNTHDHHSRKVEPGPGDSDSEGDALATQAPSRDEAAQVRAWRVERLTALIDSAAAARCAGCGMRRDWHGADIHPFEREEGPAQLAETLADAKGDDGFPVCLHRFERLTAAGCDPETAADLLVAI